MEQFEARINKLLIESDNESASGDVFITKPDKKLEEKLGIVFGMVELFALPEEFVDEFFEIVSDLKTEYYLPPIESEYGMEKRFEECLQRANRRLSKIIKKSILKIELRNINALVGLFYRNKIYLSQIGKNNAFLFHKKKKYDCVIVDIFSQAADKKSSPHSLTRRIDPEKMFSNIISGEITIKDNLFFCNDTILEYFSQNELSEIISENDHLTALNQLESGLETKSDGNNFYAIMIQPSAPIEAEEYSINTATPITKIIKERPAIIPPQHSINNLLKTQASTEQYLTPSLMPNWKKILILAFIGLKKAARYAIKYLGIFVRFIIKKSLRLLNKAVAMIKKKIGRKNHFSFGGNKESYPKKTDEAGEPKIITRESAIGVKEIESGVVVEQNNTAAINAVTADSHITKKINTSLNKLIASFVALNKLKKSLFIIAFVLIFLFSQSVVGRGQGTGRTSADDIQKTINQINEAINTAEAKNVFNDEAGAQESIATASDLLKQIPDKSKYQDTIKELQTKIDEVGKQLQKIAYLDNPTVVADLSNTNSQAQTNGLAKINNIIFTFDNQNQNIYKIDLDKKQTLPVKLDGLQNIKKIGALNDKSIIIASSNADFYQYDIAGTSTKKILSIASGMNDFDLYGGKIYTLQNGKNQIYKHLPAGGVFNDGSAWLKSGADLKDASALTIDGGVFVVRNNGGISYYAGGQLKETNFTPITPAIKSPTQLFSNVDSKYLYILDPQNQRIVVYEKTGSMKIQYTSKQFNNLKSMAVVEREKKIYVLNDNKVYQIEIGF